MLLVMLVDWFQFGGESCHQAPGYATVRSREEVVRGSDIGRFCGRLSKPLARKRRYCTDPLDMGQCRVETDRGPLSPGPSPIDFVPEVRML